MHDSLMCVRIEEFFYKSSLELIELKVLRSFPGLDTSFGDINETELCMILYLFHSAKANSI